MNQWLLKDFLRQTMIAAVYAVLVYVFSISSFGLIQFRIAEVLMILVLFDKKNVIGLTVGCFIANLLYGAILIDVIFGSLATTIAGILMYLTKSKPGLSMLFPAISNGLIVGTILTYGYVIGPLWITVPSVFLGEFVVMYALGLPLYLVLRKHKGFLEYFQ